MRIGKVRIMYSKDIKIGQFIFAKAHLNFNYL